MRLKRLSKEEEDSLGFVIVGLVRLGWSFRKIEKLIGRHIDVVSRLYSSTLDKIESGITNESIVLKGRKKEVDLLYVGGSQELENIESAKIDHQFGHLRSEYNTSDT